MVLCHALTLSLALSFFHLFNLLFQKKKISTFVTAGIPALATSQADRQPNSSLGKYQLLFKVRRVLLTSNWRETSETYKSPSTFYPFLC